jgi:hypothetical protein
VSKSDESTIYITNGLSDDVMNDNTMIHENEFCLRVRTTTKTFLHYKRLGLRALLKTE